MSLKQILFLCFAALAACTPVVPAPSATPIAQITNTAEPPTATLAAATLVAATPVATPAVETATATMTAVEIADTPTPTLTPAATPTAVTPTITPTPTLSPTIGPPFTQGQIVFLWDPAPVIVEGGSPNKPSFNLYQIIPGATPSEWYIQTPLTNLYYEADMIPSPDGTKLTLRLLRDTNGDGGVDPRKINDTLGLYTYTFSDTSFMPTVVSQEHIIHFGWLPDSDSIIYTLRTNVFLIRWDGSSQQQLTPYPTFPLIEGEESNWVNKMKVSPDGRLVAVDFMLGTAVSEGGIQPSGSRLVFLHRDTGEIVTVLEQIHINSSLELTWSPDSQWLSTTQNLYSGLFVINAETLEFIELVGEPILPNIAWSPDSRWLAFIKDSSLILWSTESFTTRELATVGVAYPPAWSADSSQVAVSFTSEEQSGLLLIEPESGNQQVIDLGIAPSFVTYSPDGQWLLFLAGPGEQSSLHIVNIASGDVYLVIDTTISPDSYLDEDAYWEPSWLLPFDIYWLPSSP